jgi:ArsR family transcriptional regulator
LAKPQAQEFAVEARQTCREELLGRLQDRSISLVNVMPPDSFTSGHIPGSINLPIAAIEEKAGEILPDVGQAIVIYCAGPN